ncbi:MAG TPA: tetratricopeptide repeat protein [Fulvivirga sp.]|nr:tetratricopeptide repeat protein [Fulvivirga sp.]
MILLGQSVAPLDLKAIGLVIILCGIFPQFTFSQNSRQDILEVDSIIQQAKGGLSDFKYDYAIALAKDALNKSNNLSYQNGIINSLLIVADGYKAKSDFPTGLNCYLQALSEIEKQENKQDLLTVNDRLGQLFFDWGIPEKALTYFNNALELNQRPFGVAQIDLLNRLAETHLRLGEYTAALTYYQQVLSIGKGNGNTTSALATLKQMALIYNQQKDFENAIKYNFEILDLNRQLKDTVNAAVSLNAIGSLYKDLNDLNKSLDYYKQALVINQQLNRKGNHDNNIVSNMINIGVIYQSLGDYRNSMRSFNEALKLKEKRGTPVEIAVMHNYLASINYNLGKNKEALEQTQKAIDLLQGSDNKRMLATNYKRMSDIYQKTGDYKSALERYEQYSLIKDSLLYREQLAQEREKYKEYVVSSTEKESKLSIIDQEMNALELRNEKVRAENEKNEIELLLREKELQNISLKNDQLLQERSLQRLQLQQEQLETKRKSQEILLLEQKRDLQTIELQKNALLEQERNQEIELQKSKLELQQSKLERGATRQKYLTGAAVLFLIILLLILLMYFIKRQDNKKLENQFLEINRQKEHIEDINKSLVQLNEEKNDLINIVAHDLKSPLNQIIGILDIVKLTAKNQDTEQQDYIAKIDQSANRLKNMVTKILDVNAIESKTLNIDLEDINLAELLRESVGQFKILAANKSIKINEEIDEGLPIMKLDRTLTAEVIQNLLSNAIKYSPIGAEVTVKLSIINKNVRMEFIDHGQGIDKEDMKKLFDKYHKLKARPTAGEDSTGLGLSIVKKYVEVLNGKVWCESEAGKGANFIVEFQS